MKQKQIFYQTQLKEISVTKNGIIRNNRTGKILKVSSRGYFTHNQKPYNLAKTILQTFKKIPVKNGRIKFLDYNERNFSPENIEYVSKLEKISQPKESDLKTLIDFYIKDKTFNINDHIQYRIYLKMILVKRRFIEENKMLFNIDVFAHYFNVSFPNFVQLAKENEISVLDAKRTIYFFLNKLINEFKNDVDLECLNQQ